MDESVWPKALPVLSDEQRRIREDFMLYWHEVLPKSFGMIERFNHGFPARHALAGRTLEIGAGLGAHIAFEDLSRQDYVALELRPEMARSITERFPGVRVVVGDCQQHIDAPDASFDRVVAIHVLEHLPDLPRALSEIDRVLKPGGQFCAVVPCEGGLAYEVARRVSARRLFERRYGMSYDWFIKSEHVNQCAEILEQLDRRFVRRTARYFPLRVPVMTINLVIGLILAKRRRSSS
jgi:SAM-dependent methyltransferase